MFLKKLSGNAHVWRTHTPLITLTEV